MKMLVDIDSETLSAAQLLLGAATKKETVNRALQEIVALAARRRDLAWLAADDRHDLGDATIMTASWQR